MGDFKKSLEPAESWQIFAQLAEMGPNPLSPTSILLGCRGFEVAAWPAES